jgi:hypothetical protein
MGQTNSIGAHLKIDIFILDVTVSQGIFYKVGGLWLPHPEKTGASSPTPAPRRGKRRIWGKLPNPILLRYFVKSVQIPWRVSHSACRAVRMFDSVSKTMSICVW